MRSEIVFFLAAIGATILNINPVIEAAPVRLIFPNTQKSTPAPPPVAGRIHIKPRSHTTKPSSSRKHRHHHNSHKKIRLNTILEVVPRRNIAPPNPWYIKSERHDRAAPSLFLGGHAVVDENDDDDGNELLDIDTDLIRPDDDDTIEGLILEEEEEDELIFSDDRAVENNQGQASFIIPDVVINNDNWITENGIEDEDFVPLNYDDEIAIEGEFESILEEEEETHEENVVILPKFGGNSAAAELAAEEP
ncbi:hypothetical protein BGZ76_005243 [Entomortierella beljakovae]|nr:hypothetical protein BGZ76_005243 [Entomortierella beljakovae]